MFLFCLHSIGKGRFSRICFTLITQVLFLIFVLFNTIIYDIEGLITVQDTCIAFNWFSYLFFVRIGAKTMLNQSV